jgi:hypothetical protein
MEEAIARAELVALPDATASGAVTIAIPRRDVETALAAEDGPMDLVLDVAWMENPDDAQPAELRKIAVSWERDQLEHLLLKADGDVVTVVFDKEGLVRLVDPDFELHGLRTGIAILAVAVAAGATSGVAFGAQVDEGASGSNAAAYTAIEQSRGAAVTPDPSGVIEAVRSVAANPGPAGAESIEAVRSAEPLVAADSGGAAAAAGGIEAVRSAEPLVADSGVASASGSIEAARAAEPIGSVGGTSAAAASGSIEATRSAEPITATSGPSGLSGAGGIEAVRSAEIAASSGGSVADDGISISMPSPQVVGFVGGMTLLLLGAAFVTRGRRPISPA